MTLIDLPKPNGKTIQEKYEYAKFLMRCKEPTLELLNFLDREQENFTYQYEQDGPWLYVYSLVWSKGELFDNISRQDTSWITCGVNGRGAGISHTYCGFSWANPYEASLLQNAVDNLILWSAERTRLAEIQFEIDIQTANRNRVKDWLNNHEES